MTYTRRSALAGVGAGLLCGRAFAQGSAGGALDLAIFNIRAWTGQRGAFTDAIGVRGNRIVAIGAAAVRAGTVRRTQAIDGQGAFAMPSITDCHTHFLRGAADLLLPDLLDVTSRAEFVDRIGRAVRSLAPGEWLRGGPWDEQRFGGVLPHREWIDAVTPDTPVAIPRTDLHSLFLNSVALRLAGITRDTPDPAGGVIERDARGEPTGVLKDNARDAVLRVIPKPSDAAIDRQLRAGIDHALSKGVTQVHNTEVNWSVHDAVRRLRRAGPTGLRFNSLVPLRDWERVVELVRTEGTGDDWVRWGGLKCVSDGSLGARTARFHEPYADAADQRGVWATSVEDMREWIPAADKAGLAIAAHAIGDEANDVVLDIFADTVRRNGARDRRFRIEHAQHLAPGAVRRMAAQGIIASVQPYHAVDDGRWAVKRIGEERLNRTYAFRSLLEGGVTTCFGSDWPVAPIDPMTGLDAAVRRQTIDGANPGGWHPEQRVGIEDALIAYTATAAYAGFQEDRFGRIALGMIGDFILLDRNLLTAGPADYLRPRVLRTFVDGRERYAASDA
ncbi:amidohydrolase [Sphingomonas sp. ac-8]|uniref:amidohydrolase n=1 Tax=Sphingomonas sp. ac-8 TaxID=3242977 RepID=UPI003A805501